MKTLIASILILCSVIITTVFVTVHTDKLLSRLEYAIDSESDGTKKGTDKIEDEYRRIKTHLDLFLYDTDVCELEAYIEDIKSAAQEDDTTELITAKNRLRLHIRQLRRLSAFSIEAIL